MSRNEIDAVLRVTALSAEVLCPLIIGTLIMARTGKLGEALTYLRAARRDALQLTALIELAIREIEAEQKRVRVEAIEELAQKV